MSVEAEEAPEGWASPDEGLHDEVQTLQVASLSLIPSVLLTRNKLEPMFIKFSLRIFFKAGKTKPKQ